MVVAMILLLVSCSNPNTREDQQDFVFVPEKANVKNFLLTEFKLNCQQAEFDGKVLIWDSVIGPVQCLVVIVNFEEEGNVLSIAETFSANGIPVLQISRVALPVSYWKRVIHHEKVHMDRITSLTPECRLSADCRLQEELIAYEQQFNLLEKYWIELGWDGVSDPPTYTDDDGTVTFEVLSFERELYLSWKKGELQDHLEYLGYSE